jgi:hypothetical protein
MDFKSNFNQDFLVKMLPAFQAKWAIEFILCASESNLCYETRAVVILLKGVASYLNEFAIYYPIPKSAYENYKTKHQFETSLDLEQKLCGFNSCSDSYPYTYTVLVHEAVYKFISI